MIQPPYIWTSERDRQECLRLLFDLFNLEVITTSVGVFDTSLSIFSTPPDVIRAYHRKVSRDPVAGADASPVDLTCGWCGLPESQHTAIRDGKRVAGAEWDCMGFEPQRAVVARGKGA